MSSPWGWVVVGHFAVCETSGCFYAEKMSSPRAADARALRHHKDTGHATAIESRKRRVVAQGVLDVK